MVKALTRLCGGTERSAKSRRQEVADRLRVNEQTLYQIIRGIKLESGRPRTVGRQLREKLDAEFPGWFTEDDAAAQSAAAPLAVQLTSALQVIRNQLAHVHGEASAAAAEALHLLALTPDSERAFRNALTVLLPTPGEHSPRESGDTTRQAHIASYRQADTSPANPHDLGGGDQPNGGEEWTRKGKLIGQSIKPIHRTTAKSLKPGKGNAK